MGRKSDFVTFLSPLFMATCVRKIFNERFRSRDTAPVQNSVEDDGGFRPSPLSSRCVRLYSAAEKILSAKFASFSFGITNLRLTLGSSREGYVRRSHSGRINISIFVVFVGFRGLGWVRMGTRRFVPASFR